MTAVPLQFEAVWSDGVFRPLSRFHNSVAANVGEGEIVSLERYEERSEKSHKHEFAWLREAWKNLPETLADQYPTPDSLRKRALIAAGYYDEQVIDAGSNAAALRVAAGLRARPGEQFTMIVVRGPIVVMRTAKSQSRRVMKGPEFQASKTAILEIVAEMIGVEPAQLGRAA